MTLRLWLILGTVVGILSLAGYIYWRGGDDAREAQAVEQLKHEKKVRKAYDKIDRHTPYNADKRDALDWLYQFGRE